MVEAPRIRIIYENVRNTKYRTIINASGPTYKKIGIDLIGYKIRKWWYAGKYIYLLLVKNGSPSYVVRTHTMMYGKITINGEQKSNPFLVLELDNGTKLKWYKAQIKILDPNCEIDLIKSNYTTCSSKEGIKDSFRMMKYDISNKSFDMNLLLEHITQNIEKIGNDILVDFLLNQYFFPGVGNILQQEALYECKFLPTKTVKEIGKEGIECLINALKEIINKLYQSYLDKLENKTHKPILKIYHKSLCPLGHKTITKYLGYHNRRTTWCPICQK